MRSLWSGGASPPPCKLLSIPFHFGSEVSQLLLASSNNERRKVKGVGTKRTDGRNAFVLFIWDSKNSEFKAIYSINAIVAEMIIGNYYFTGVWLIKRNNLRLPFITTFECETRQDCFFGKLIIIDVICWAWLISQSLPVPGLSLYATFITIILTLNLMDKNVWHSVFLQSFSICPNVDSKIGNTVFTITLLHTKYQLHSLDPRKSTEFSLISSR